MISIRKNTLKIVAFSFGFLLVSFYLTADSLSGIDVSFYFLGILLVYTIINISIQSTQKSGNSFAPWVGYPILVTFYYLAEPIIGGAAIGAKRPLAIAEVTLYYLSFFLVSCYITNFFVVRQKLTYKNFEINELSLTRMALGMFAISLIVHLYVISSLGFLPLRPDFEIIRTELPQHISGYATYLMYLSVPSSIIFFSISCRTENKKLKRLCFTLGVISSVLPLHTGNRTRFLVSVIVPLLIRWSYSNTWPKTSKVALFSLIGLIIMGFVGAVRLSSFMQGSYFELALVKLSAELGLGPYSLDLIISRIANSAHYVDVSWLFSPLTSLLPGKDVTLVRYLKDFFSLEFVGGGFTPTIIGSFYIYGGLNAVIVGAIFYGFIQTKLFHWFYREKSVEAKYWKSLTFYLNFLFLCITVKNGFFISIEFFFYLVSLNFALYMSKVKLNT